MMVALLFSAGAALAADAPAPAPVAPAAPVTASGAATASVTPVAAIAWQPLNPKNPAGVQMAVVHGDVPNGPVSFFMKFPPGSASPQHAHTNDYYGVVVSGTPGHGATADAAATPLTAGAWWYQPGLQFHYDRCLGPDAWVLRLTFPAGGFDYVPGK